MVRGDCRRVMLANHPDAEINTRLLTVNKTEGEFLAVIPLLILSSPSNRGLANTLQWATETPMVASAQSVSHYLVPSAAHLRHR